MKKIKDPILITGATGFVGANLARKLIQKGYRPTIIIRRQSNLWRIKDVLKFCKVYYADLTNRKALEKVIGKIKPQTIFHLAAYGTYPFQKEPEKIFEVDILGTLNLIEACGKAGFYIFINTGSSSEYGQKSKPMFEDDLLAPNNYYAVAKAAQTLLCQHLAREKKLPIITLRPFSVYGPYEELSRLISTLINNCLENKDLFLASPQIARDFIFIDDVTDAYLKAACRPKLGGQIFNLASGCQSTLKEIVSVVIKITGAKIKQNWNAFPSRSFDTNVWVADIGKIKRSLDWQPKYNLEDGLKKTIIWFKKNREKI